MGKGSVADDISQKYDTPTELKKYSTLLDKVVTEPNTEGTGKANLFDKPVKLGEITFPM